jgi:hypothetical protein
VQILAASTYPTEIGEADRSMQSHSNLKAKELAKAVAAMGPEPGQPEVANVPGYDP